MSTWDYRIIKKEYKNNDGVILDASYFIVEAFYDENGKVCMCTQEPEGPFGDTIEEMMKNWAMLAEAFNKPILNFDEIPEEGSVNEVEERIKELEDEHGNMRPTDELIEEGKLIPHENVFENLRNNIGSKFENSEKEIFRDFDMDVFRKEEEQKRNGSELKHTVENVGVPWPSIAMSAFSDYLEELAGEEDVNNDDG